MKKMTVKIKPLILSLAVGSICVTMLGACSKGGQQESWYSEDVWYSTESQQSESAPDESAPQGQKTDANGKVTKAPNKKTTTAAGGKKNTTTANKAVSSNADVKGYTFNLYDEWAPTKITKTSTTFEKMLFQRIEEVEKELGCTIKITNNFYVGMDSMSPLILSGKKVADIIAMMPRQITAMAGNNYIIDLKSVNGINVKDSKWNASYTKVATVNNKVYGLSFTKPPEVRMCVIFNKTLLSNSGVDANGIYNLVRNKKWTFSKFAEYAKAATKTTNGKTTTWGVGGAPKYVTECLLGANNANLVTLSGNAAKATFSSQQSIDAIKFFDQLVNTDKSFMIADGMRSISTYAASVPDYTNAFLKGKVAFLIEDSWVVNQKVKLGVKNFDWGVVPLPMGPNASGYVSPAENANLYCITSTNKDLAKTVKIFNALAEPAKGYEDDDWWLDEIQEDYFQSNDKDSLEMYRLCLDNSTYDVGIGVESLLDAFLNNGVYGPVFYGSGNTVETGIKSISGTYDNAIASTFKGILSK